MRRGQMRLGRSFGLTLALLVAVNVLRSFGWLGPPVVSATVLTAGALLVAWLSGATLGDLGLRRSNARAGFLYGTASVVIVAITLSLAIWLPLGREFLDDSRADIDGWHLVLEVVVSVTLLTAVPEEIAFRGVLFGSAVRLWGTWRAAVVTSLFFGLWHIAPTLQTMSGNKGIDDATDALSPVLGDVLTVLGSVVITFVAGLVFCWLRERSHSLVAPILAHAGVNGCALVAAWSTLH